MAVGVIVGVAEGLGVAVGGSGLGDIVADGLTVAVGASGVEVGAGVGAAVQDTINNNNRNAEMIFFNGHLSLLKSHHTSN